MKRPERPTSLYIFRGVDFMSHYPDWPRNAYKIGVSHTPHTRIYDCYGAKEIVHTITFRTRKGAHLAEHWLHDICTPLAVKGHNEWFRFDNEAIGALCQITCEKMAFDFIEACVKDENDRQKLAIWKSKRSQVEHYSALYAPISDIAKTLIALDTENMTPREALKTLRMMQEQARNEVGK